MQHLRVLIRLLTSPNLLLRHLRLYFGLFLYGASIALMVSANIGASPWDVFGQGVARSTGLSFGLATVLISIGVLLLWIPIRQRPGWGTIANTVLVGLAADVVLQVLGTPQHLVFQGLMFTAGLVLLALATALYIGAGMGPGPRDGLMTGLVRLTGWPVWTVRGSIELSVVAVGFLLGGVVGLGTVVFALAIGPLVQQALRTLRVPVRGERNP